MKENKRDSSLELLRIVTMFCIVAHHYVVNSGVMLEITQSNVLTKNALFALLFGWGGKTGINCFILITGYFMCTSNISIRKFIRLFMEILFYRISFWAVFVLSGYTGFTRSGLLNAVLPHGSIGVGFIGSYLVFFLFIPYLNILIKHMEKKQYRVLLGISFVTGTLLQTFLKAPAAFTYVGWFMVMYLWGGYIRLYDKELFENKKWKYMAIVSLALSWFSVAAGAVLYQKTGVRMYYHFVSDSNKILAFLTAICAFVCFRNLKLKYNAFINKVAGSAFGVLLIHANSDVMRQWLWKDTLKNATVFHGKYFILHACLCVTVIYIVCTIIDWGRLRFVEMPFMKWYDRHFGKK